MQLFSRVCTGFVAVLVSTINVCFAVVSPVCVGSALVISVTAGQYIQLSPLQTMDAGSRAVAATVSDGYTYTQQCVLVLRLSFQ